jgi:hypothetical protein
VGGCSPERVISTFPFFLPERIIRRGCEGRLWDGSDRRWGELEIICVVAPNIDSLQPSDGGFERLWCLVGARKRPIGFGQEMQRFACRLAMIRQFSLNRCVSGAQVS